MKDPDHAKLSACSYRYEMQLVDDAGVAISVIWTTLRKNVYKVTIERDSGQSGQKPYSLYNLNIQGRVWPVTVTHDTSDGVTVELSESTNDPEVFQKFPPTAAGGKGEQWVVPKTNPLGDKTDPTSDYYKPVQEDNILFLTFSGRKCSLTVQAQRATLSGLLAAPALDLAAVGGLVESHGGFGDPGSTGGD